MSILFLFQFIYLKKKWNLETNIAEIRLIIFFTAKDGEALYSQQKQDRELTVA